MSELIILIKRRNADAESDLAPLLRVLVENHERFLAFLRPHVSGEEIAEEILQTALLKGMQSGGSIRDGETAVAWFYRLLRNAVAEEKNAV